VPVKKKGKQKRLGDYGATEEYFPDATRVTNAKLEGEVITIEKVRQASAEDREYYVVLAKWKGEPVSFGTGEVQTRQIDDFLEDGGKFPQEVKVERPRGKRYYLFANP